MRFFFPFLMLTLPLWGFANAAQPGILNAGGAGTFFLFYPEDSLGFQKVQMVKEQVKVQLYRGFSVVRGITNEAFVSEGYNRGTYNAFIYLLESGSTWKQPIGKGTILVKLMDGLTLDDVRGVSPSDEFLVNEEQNLLVWQFENLPPLAADNPVITYGEELVNNPFHTVKFQAEEYFQAIQAFNAAEALTLDLQPRAFGDPHAPGTSWEGEMVGGLFLLFVYGLPLLLLLCALGLGLFLSFRWKRRTRSAKKNNYDKVHLLLLRILVPPGCRGPNVY